MMIALAQQRPRGELRINEPMARHISWRVGGVADRFYRPADLDDLKVFLHGLSDGEPVTWIGLGSNVLIRDGGVRGTVVVTAGRLNAMAPLSVDHVRVEAGVYCAKVARYCAGRGLEGAEFLAGIPGTLGGALTMNAGAFGAEIWACVVQVETLDRHGSHRLRRPKDFTVSYRQVLGPVGEWFVAAHLRLQRGNGEVAKQKIRELLRRRAASQPTQLPSCGSVFRNPPGDYAARLIEAAGLKGYCRGGACVAEQHANFIVNRGLARASDIEALIEHVAATVERAHGVRLEREVHIIGEPLSAGAGKD